MAGLGGIFDMVDWIQRIDDRLEALDTRLRHLEITQAKLVAYVAVASAIGSAVFNWALNLLR